jgi:L-seryl-tRNA(Ser) seleniumtransferase
LYADVEQLRGRAASLVDALRHNGIEASTVDSQAAVGGGGAPGVSLPSAAVSLPAAYAESLRAGRPAVLGRIERDRCLLDLRALTAADDETLLAAVLSASGRT